MAFSRWLRPRTQQTGGKAALVDLVAKRSMLLGVVLVAQLAGCATLTEGSAQTIRIETDPPGARCTITRAGAVVTSIPSTPATISLLKQPGELAMHCSKSGYLDAKLEQSAKFSGTVFGNILFGGLIGAAIDMGSGATHKYPEWIWLSLIPEQFESPQSRDKFFSRLVERVTEKHHQMLAQQQEKCTEQDCERLLDPMRQEFQDRLRVIEQQRQDAVLIDTKQPPQKPSKVSRLKPDSLS